MNTDNDSGEECLHLMRRPLWCNDLFNPCIIRVNPWQIILISIVQLGTVDYATGLRLQQQLVALVKKRRSATSCCFSSTQPVITLGRNAKAANVIASPELLAQRGVELFECDRGGDVTFHGPGQIVGYPIFDLRGIASSGRANAKPGVIEFVRRLEDVLIRTCADFGISAKRVPGLTGVWTDPVGSAVRSKRVTDSTSSRIGRLSTRRSCRKRGSGFPLTPSTDAARSQTSRHRRPHLPLVTSHGFALNVNTDLSYFNLIIPCGITTKPVTSMQKELGSRSTSTPLPNPSLATSA